MKLPTMWTRVCIILLLAFVSFSNPQPQEKNYQKLPDYIAPCFREDPNLTVCVNSTVYGIIRKLANGIPELDVPPIEPLFKDEIDAFNVAGFHLKIKNITVRGVSKLNIEWASASTKTKLYAFEGYIDPLNIDAVYELSGYFFLVPVHATGTIQVIGRNLKFRVDAIVNVLPENGVDFVKINDLQVKANVDDGSLWISNLGLFEVAINSLLNNRFNKGFIINHMTPIIEDTVAGIMQKFSNRIFNTVPYDTFLPKGNGPVPAYTVKPPDDVDKTLRFYNKKNFLDKVMSILY